MDGNRFIHLESLLFLLDLVCVGAGSHVRQDIVGLDLSGLKNDGAGLKKKKDNDGKSYAVCVLYEIEPLTGRQWITTDSIALYRVLWSTL